MVRERSERAPSFLSTKEAEFIGMRARGIFGDLLASGKFDLVKGRPLSYVADNIADPAVTRAALADLISRSIITPYMVTEGTRGPVQWLKPVSIVEAVITLQTGEIPEEYRPGVRNVIHLVHNKMKQELGIVDPPVRPTVPEPKVEPQRLEPTESEKPKGFGRTLTINQDTGEYTLTDKRNGQDYTLNLRPSGKYFLQYLALFPGKSKPPHIVSSEVRKMEGSLQIGGILPTSTPQMMRNLGMYLNEFSDGENVLKVEKDEKKRRIISYTLQVDSATIISNGEAKTITAPERAAIEPHTPEVQQAEPTPLPVIAETPKEPVVIEPQPTIIQDETPEPPAVTEPQASTVQNQEPEPPPAITEKPLKPTTPRHVPVFERRRDKPVFSERAQKFLQNTDERFEIKRGLQKARDIHVITFAGDVPFLEVRAVYGGQNSKTNHGSLITDPVAVKLFLFLAENGTNPVKESTVQKFLAKELAADKTRPLPYYITLLRRRVEAGVGRVIEVTDSESGKEYSLTGNVHFHKEHMGRSTSATKRGK